MRPTHTGKRRRLQFAFRAMNLTGTRQLSLQTTDQALIAPWLINVFEELGDMRNAYSGPEVEVHIQMVLLEESDKC